MEDSDSSGSGFIDFLVRAAIVTGLVLMISWIYKIAWGTFKLLFGWALPKVKEVDPYERDDEKFKDMSLSDEARTSNISLEFERAFILHKEREDEGVLNRYTDLLSGKILDKEIEHAPSEILNGDRNPHYLRYLNVQRSLFIEEGLDIDWLEGEIARVQDCSDLKSLMNKYSHLLTTKYEMPESFALEVINLPRLTSLSPKMWEDVAKAIRSAVETGIDTRAIRLLLDYQPEAFTEHQAVLVDHLVRIGLPEDIIERVLGYGLDLKDAYKIAELKAEGLSWDMAVRTAHKRARAEV